MTRHASLPLDAQEPAPPFDPLDPQRPALAVLVGQVLLDAERRGEARADARYSALLDRIAGVVLQRQDLAVDKDRQAERLYAGGSSDAAKAHDRWAAELRGQVDAIRSTLDPAEAAEVGLRVERLRAAREEPA